MTNLPTHKQIHILLVEDQPQDIRTIWNLLHEKSRFHFDIEAIVGIPDALERLSKQNIDVVLLDLALVTHREESEAVTTILKSNPRIAVVVLTTLEDEAAGLRALEGGAQDYLLKEEIGARALVRALHYAVERKRAEELVSAAEEKYRTLFNWIDEGFCIIEVLFDENNRPVDYQFLEVNQAFERVTGIKDAVGRRMREIAPEHEEYWFEIYGKVATTGEPLRFENQARQLNRYFDVYAFRVGLPTERKVGILVYDITERKRIEEQRIALLTQEQAARTEAERAIAMQRLFLGFVSHELRTPLTSIKGFSTTLLATDVTFEPEQIRTFVQIIVAEADKLSNLVTDLMDVVQLQAGVFRVTLQKEDINAVITNTLPELYVLTAEHHLVMALPSDLPPVQVDRHRIGQVLVNLISNAVKFSPPQTSITVTGYAGEGWVQISVSDEGKGIPHSKRETIFEAFHQVLGKSERQAGSGLGLTICRGIIEAHNGTIWIEDRPGSGATISFTLPVHTQG